MRNNVASRPTVLSSIFTNGDNNNKWLITGDWWLISWRMSDENGINRRFLLQCLYYPSVSRQRESRTLAARVRWAAIHMACRPDRRGRRHRRESGGSGCESLSRRSPQNPCLSACHDAVRTLRVLWVIHLSTGWTRTGLQTRRSLSRATGAARSRCADIRDIWPPALWTCAPGSRTEPISIRGCDPRLISRVAYPRKSGHSASVLLARSGTMRDPCKSVLEIDI